LPAVSARPATADQPGLTGPGHVRFREEQAIANRLYAPAKRFFPWLMRSSRNPGPRRSTIRCPLTECDLDAYAVLADEFSAGSVPDTGCGTRHPAAGVVQGPPYRARMVREARALLAEMGCALPGDAGIRVWDSSAEVRYLVLPERPRGTEDMTEAMLAGLVTRDSMIGVARL
jgi:Nitrile hydratase, alpha chain